MTDVDVGSRIDKNKSSFKTVHPIIKFVSVILTFVVKFYYIS